MSNKTEGLQEPWKKVLVHVNLETGELHYDGDDKARDYIKSLDDGYADNYEALDKANDVIKAMFGIVRDSYDPQYHNELNFERVKEAAEIGSSYLQDKGIPANTNSALEEQVKALQESNEAKASCVMFRDERIQELEGIIKKLQNQGPKESVIHKDITVTHKLDDDFKKLIISHGYFVGPSRPISSIGTWARSFFKQNP